MVRNLLPALLALYVLVPTATLLAAEKLPERGRIPVLAWIGPPAAQASVERYRELADCGFTMSFSSFGDAGAMSKALDAAKEAGVQLLVSCPELAAEPEATAKRFKDNSAVGGYFLRDEPSSNDFAVLGNWARSIQSVDRDHIVYINLFPNYANAEQLKTKSYQEYVDRFLARVPVPVISFDFYPIVGNSVRPQWYENLQTIASGARKAEKPLWAFALSVRHWDYPVATLAHLREQVYSDLAYGAQGIEYFTYWTPDDPIFSDAPIDRKGRRTVVYDRVKRMNAEVRALSGVFRGSHVVALGHAGSALPAGAKRYVPQSPVESLTTGDVGGLVSLLANGDDRYLLIVNRDIKAPMALKISFDASTEISRVEKDGLLGTLDRRQTQAAIEPGDAIIFAFRPHTDRG